MFSQFTICKASSLPGHVYSTTNEQLLFFICCLPTNILKNIKKNTSKFHFMYPNVNTGVTVVIRLGSRFYQDSIYVAHPPT